MDEVAVCDGPMLMRDAVKDGAQGELGGGKDSDGNIIEFDLKELERLEVILYLRSFLIPILTNLPPQVQNYI